MDVSKLVKFIGTISLTSIIAFLLSTPFISLVSAQTPYFPIYMYPSDPVDGDLVEVSVSNYNDLAAGAVFEWYHNGTKVREIEKTFTDTLLSDSYAVQPGEWTVTVHVYDRTELKQEINSSTISFTVRPSLPPAPEPTPTPSPTPIPTPTATPAPTPEPTVAPRTSGGGGGGAAGGGGGGAPATSQPAPQPTTTPTATPTPEPTPTPAPTIPPATAPSPPVTQKPGTPAPSADEAEKERPSVDTTERIINETGEVQESTPEQAFKTPLGVEVGIFGLIVALILRKRT